MPTVAHQRHEPGDVAGVVGTDLDHRGRVVVLETQQRQRHTDMIVEVAAGRVARPLLKEDRRDQLLGRGLAVAAGNRDHRDRELSAPRFGGALQRQQRVIDHDLRQPKRQAARDHGAGRTACAGGRDEIVRVEVRTRQRHEQLAALERPGIGRDGGEGGVRTE
jgi:hypothetical protein